jgi:hypothetical protein
MDFNESDAYFSPDMRWVAYKSGESGRDEAYVQAFSQRSGDCECFVLSFSDHDIYLGIGKQLESSRVREIGTRLVPNSRQI